jgi:hypothetical protein
MRLVPYVAVILSICVALVLFRARTGSGPLEEDGGFVSTRDFPALIKSLQETGTDGSRWVVLVPGTHGADGYTANLQFSIEANELGMDWVLLAESNRHLRYEFLEFCKSEGLSVRELHSNGVRYVRATGTQAWPEIGERLLLRMFEPEQTASMQLLVAGFEWRTTPARH